MAHPMITDLLGSSFRSDRLTYRAVENDQQTKHFIHTELDNNPVNIVLGDPNVVRPANLTHTEWVMDQLAKSDLGVIICLQTPPGTAIGANPIPIGFLSVGWGGRAPTQYHHRSTSIGISLAARYQNKGYGGEAINWALDWAFRLGGFHRVEISTVSYNERAMHLYQRLGFYEEGRSREAYWYDRKWYDVVSYGMLEREWTALRGIVE